MSDDTASRLYLDLPKTLDAEAFAPRLRDVLATVDIACVRLDLGPAPEEDWVQAANHLIGPCHDADVALVVTDHYRLVGALGLDGVHIGPAGPKIREVRKALGPDAIVGAYAGTSRHQGMVLAEAGADYVAFGPLHADGLLGPEDVATDALFAWWAEMIETPSVVEGGLTLADATRLESTADFFMPGSDLWAEADPAAILAAFAEILA